MKPETIIERIMRTDFASLAPETPIREAVAMLARRRAPAALVIDASGTLVGILTEKDCFRPMLNASYYQQWDGSVAEHMSREILTLPVDLDFVSAAEEVLARSHRVYPVMRDGEVAGLLHRSDLLSAAFLTVAARPWRQPLPSIVRAFSMAAPEAVLSKTHQLCGPTSTGSANTRSIEYRSSKSSAWSDAQLSCRTPIMIGLHPRPVCQEKGTQRDH